MHNKYAPTIIQKVDNHLFIKREDLIPISFGGNKARKAKYFFDEIDKNHYDAVVTYGSGSSNHCRIVANLCANRQIPCYIISPKEASEESFNMKMIQLFGAIVLTVPVDSAHNAIENKLLELKENNHNPFFIPGGGHGNLGTQAYIDCYGEIKEYEKENDLIFDYIFFASGTGTTHSGLICGEYLNNDNKRIIGISIARKNPKGRQVVLDSVYEYLDANKITYKNSDIEKLTIFEDSYTGDGYGRGNLDIDKTIIEILLKYGIPLDSTYTGKAFSGMRKYIEKNNIENKNILFIHTGGTPLFFNDLERIKI